MLTLKEINPIRLNNPDANEKTLFLDEADSKLKTKDSAGVVEELAVVDENATAGPLVYKALVTQTGTDAPVATVLENTLGGTVVWARTGVGTYTGTLTGAFPTNKTIGPNFGVGGVNYVGSAGGLRQYALQRQTNDNIILYYFNTGTGLATELNNSGQAPEIYINIEVYP